DRLHQESRSRARVSRRACGGGDGADHRRAPRVRGAPVVRHGAAVRPVVVGAVLYDPKVSVIWDIIRNFFEARGCAMDVVLFADYELQVNALLEGKIDVAWNSPLAWVDAQRRSNGSCRAIAMRDTDRDRRSYLVVPNFSGIRSLADLRGRTLAV